jgi:hypothetical protein
VSPYPNRNPFPTQATMTIEARMTYSLKDVPTLKREPMQRLVTLARRYLSDDPADRVGWAVAMRGAHGTGKTHSLLYALAELTVRGPPDQKAPLVLYVRADGPSPVSLYGKLMSQLSAGDLRSLAEDAFAGYAAEAFTETRTPSPERGEEVPDELRASPSLVRDALREKELSWTAVMDQHELDMERIQKRLGRFDRPVRDLLEPRLEALAHRWLTGDTLDEEELKTLGMDSNIVRSDDARLGLHVFAMLARAARRPLVLMVDQAEALIRAPAGVARSEPDDKSIGWLRGVVEAFEEERAFLVVAISQYGWTQIPRDLQMRFGQSVITVRGLTMDEAKATLALYLEPWEPEPPTFPFQQDAVRRLLMVSGGNPRRFLQAARHAFAEAAPTKAAVDARLVELAVAGSPDRPPTEAEVRQTVERVLARKHLPFKSDHAVSGAQHVDYAVMRGRQPMFYIEISDAVFALEEAQAAVQNLEKIKAALELRVPTILIVLGYSSPEVMSGLEQVATSVIVAEDSNFETRLTDAVGDSMTEGPEHLGELITELEELKAEFARLAETRGVDEQLVSDRLRAVDAEMADTRRGEELRTFRRTWAAERERIERAITERRAELRHSDVADVVERHQAYLRDVKRRRRTATIAATLMLIGGGAVIFALISAPDITLAFVLAAIGLVVATDLLLTSRLDADVEGAGRIRTPDQLEQFVRERYSRGMASHDSPDPFRRYAAAWEEPGPAVLRAAEQESQPLVQRRLVSAVLAEGPGAIEAALTARLDPPTLSLAVEQARRGQIDGDSLTRLPRRLQLVAELTGPDWEDAFFDRFPPELARAFRDDNEELLALAVATVSERELRRAIAALSPFEDEGLGAWYWLESLDRVDDVFLFLRRAAFLAAGGLETPAATGDA